jgi:hypothetical protein
MSGVNAIGPRLVACPEGGGIMRIFLAAILLGGALLLAALDWQATIGQGYAYRFSTLGTLIQGYWPEGYMSLVVSLKQSGVPFAWDPVGAIVMSIPVALVLAAVGAGLVVTRERARVR